jgi:hypothetical protein
MRDVTYQTIAVAVAENQSDAGLGEKKGSPRHSLASDVHLKRGKLVDDR